MLFILFAAICVIFMLIMGIMMYRQHERQLERKIREQEQRLHELMQGMLGVLATAIEFRDHNSGDHVRRICGYTRDLMAAISERYPHYQISQPEIDKIASAAILHDVGKIAVPDRILSKNGKLTDEEYEEIKLHTIRGCEILKRMPDMLEEDVYQYAYDICRHHHERWDGGGYPDGLQGTEISVWAQVVGVVDAYDALTSERPYKKMYDSDTAAEMILRGECGAFNPEILEVFESCRLKWNEKRS